jgi:hypothetical protein
MTTKIDWKNPDKCHPNESCDVVVIMDYGRVTTLPYSKKYDGFNVLDSHNPEDARRCSMTDNVKYWTYLHDFLRLVTE